MKRWSLLVLLLAATAAVGSLPRPDPPPEPLAGVVIARPGIESPIDAAIWYCPWAQSNADRDSFLAVASLAPAEAEFTLPVAIPGEPADTAVLATFGPGANGFALSTVAQRGDSAAFIEFTDGPSAVGVTVIGDVVTSDMCVATGPEEWFFSGGSTMMGDTLELRLFNPFPEVAKVTVTGFSEIGVEALGELRSISVNPRSWRTISFGELLRQRQALIVSVRANEGLIVPAMTLRTGGDEAWWPGSGLADTWEFPVAQTEGTAGVIVVGNPGLSEVELTVDLFAETESFPSALVVTVPPESPLRIDLSEVGEGAFGARIVATAPVTAAVVATGDAGTGVTTGVPVGDRIWLLPGLRTQGPDEGVLWLLNTSFDPITATVSALTGSDILNSQHTVAPGSLVRIPLTDGDAFGYLVRSIEPLVAGYTITGPTGVGFATGLPVGHE